MLQSVQQSLTKHSKIIAFIAVGFVLSLLAGMVTAKWGPEPIASWVTAEDTRGNEQVERIFGRFRESVREGEPGTMATCALIVFGLNTLGSIMRSISTLFIFPLAFLFFSSWTFGVSLPGLHGSSFLSVFLFFLMVGLEWITYVLSAAAGTSIGLAVLFPKRVERSTRWSAFKHALSQAGSLYVVIVVILAAQAAFEILYVRKVLLMGGTGVPLMPY